MTPTTPRMGKFIVTLACVSFCALLTPTVAQAFGVHSTPSGCKLYFNEATGNDLTYATSGKKVAVKSPCGELLTSGDVKNFATIYMRPGRTRDTLIGTLADLTPPRVCVFSLRPGTDAIETDSTQCHPLRKR